MQYSEGIIPEDNLNNLKNYIDTKYNDVYSFIENLLTKVNNNETEINNIRDIITDISNVIPRDLSDTINNLGNEFDFENGLKDSLENKPEIGNYLFYRIGYITGNYIKQKLVNFEPVEYFVNPTDGNDNNDGLSNETPFKHFSKAISEVIFNKHSSTINITQTGSEVYQEIYILEKKKEIETICIDEDNLPYIIQFKNLPNNITAKLIFKNIDRVIFKNITFIHDDVVDSNDNLSFNNTVFYLENTNIEFIRCNFINNGQGNPLWILAKNSRITLDSCNFPDDNLPSVFLSSVNKKYYNELLNVNSNIGSTTNLIDNQSNIKLL